MIHGPMACTHAMRAYVGISLHIYVIDEDALHKSALEIVLHCSGALSWLKVFIKVNVQLFPEWRIAGH